MQTTDTHQQPQAFLSGAAMSLPFNIWRAAFYPKDHNGSHRVPDFVIGKPDNPYLIRWWMIPRNEAGNHYRHCILKSDDDRALHDHPWASVSVVLSGTLKEHLPNGEARILKIGQPYFREATDLHRLEVIDGPVWTDFYTGPKLRDWGFQCPEDSAAGGWRRWQDFVAENPGEVGRGCGEMNNA